MRSLLGRIGPVVLAIAITWYATSATAAQSAIPNGVFVKDMRGQVWLVLDGKRVKVALWPADVLAVQAIPESGEWAVMNSTGGIVAGAQPAWYVYPPRPSTQLLVPNLVVPETVGPDAARFVWRQGELDGLYERDGAQIGPVRGPARPTSDQFDLRGGNYEVLWRASVAKRGDLCVLQRTLRRDGDPMYVVEWLPAAANDTGTVIRQSSFGPDMNGSEHLIGLQPGRYYWDLSKLDCDVELVLRPI